VKPAYRDRFSSLWPISRRSGKGQMGSGDATKNSTIPSVSITTYTALGNMIIIDQIESRSL
jgi:hypothetical protein